MHYNVIETHTPWNKLSPTEGTEVFLVEEEEKKKRTR